MCRRPSRADDEVVVRVEATPINPSDLGLLIGPADMSTAKVSGTKDAARRHGEDARCRDADDGRRGSISRCRSAMRAPAP